MTDRIVSYRSVTRTIDIFGERDVRTEPLLSIRHRLDV
jgi:hypothetical protein